MKLPSLEFGFDFHPLMYTVPVPLQDSLVITKSYFHVKIFFLICKMIDY